MNGLDHMRSGGGDVICSVIARPAKPAVAIHHAGLLRRTLHATPRNDKLGSGCIIDGRVSPKHVAAAASVGGLVTPKRIASATREGGFTLIELLLALALLTMLVTALLTFVFSMGEIWGRGSGKRLFEQHVNAVTRHVESLLRRAAWPRGGPGPAEPFAVHEVRPESGASGPLLGFDLLDGDRLLDWPEQPLPEVRCHLAVERERGLVLHWQSLLEKDAADKPPRTVPVSPLVAQLAFAYQDPGTGSWRTEPALRKNAAGEWLLPDRLILTFRQEAFEAVRELTLPAGGTPPLY